MILIRVNANAMKKRSKDSLSIGDSKAESSLDPDWTWAEFSW